MQGQALLGSAKNAFVALLSVIIFPLAWMKAFGIAKQHEDEDPRGRMKVAIAIVAGIGLAGGGAVMMMGFHDGGIDGVYETFDVRLSVALGNEAYKAAVDEGRTDDAAGLEGNAALYQQVHLAVLAKDDARIRALVDGRPASVDFENLDARVDSAFRLKDDAISDFGNVMLWFVYPNIIGLFFAPLVWATGSILLRGFEKSPTVGFKPYPSGAASLFLLLGGFGWPALPFAAWVMNDMKGRAEEGQIAL